jgi:hypothetical protein
LLFPLIAARALPWWRSSDKEKPPNPGLRRFR